MIWCSSPDHSNGTAARGRGSGKSGCLCSAEHQHACTEENSMTFNVDGMLCKPSCCPKRAWAAYKRQTANGQPPQQGPSTQPRRWRYCTNQECPWISPTHTRQKVRVHLSALSQHVAQHLAEHKLCMYDCCNKGSAPMRFHFDKSFTLATCVDHESAASCRTWPCSCLLHGLVACPALTDETCRRQAFAQHSFATKR